MTKRKATTDAMKFQALKRAEVRVRCIGCVGANNSLLPDHNNPPMPEWHPLSDIHFDHVQALVDGGAHDAENLRPLCSYHNSRKGNFEHSRNSKSKRLAKAQAAFNEIMTKLATRPKGKIKSAGFPKHLRKRMSGRVERV